METWHESPLVSFSALSFPSLFFEKRPRPPSMDGIIRFLDIISREEGRHDLKKKKWFWVDVRWCLGHNGIISLPSSPSDSPHRQGRMEEFLSLFFHLISFSSSSSIFLFFPLWSPTHHLRLSVPGISPFGFCYAHIRVFALHFSLVDPFLQEFPLKGRTSFSMINWEPEDGMRVTRILMSFSMHSKSRCVTLWESLLPPASNS